MIKGILLDKDGTLIDFYSLWLQAALLAVPQFLKENKIKISREMVDYLLHTLGVRDNQVDPNGSLAYKSYGEIAKELSGALLEKGIGIDSSRIHKQIVKIFEHILSDQHMVFNQIGHVEYIIKFLKKQNICIGLATADTMNSAKSCLKSMGILELFDYIGADDGIKRPKPETDMFLEFQKCFQLRSEEIAVVGDTYNDILFARQSGGVAIGVLSGVSSSADFRGEADYIIESIQELPELLDSIKEDRLWQKYS